MSQSAPLAPQVWPGDPKSYQNGAHGCQNTNPGSSKRRPRVSKCSPRARKYVPNCTFFQKASQSAHRPRRPGPELQEAIKIKPTGVKIRPPGHQNGDRECLNAALGARKYVPKITRRKIEFHRPKSRSPPSISKPLHRSYVEPSNYGPPGRWS